MTILWDPHKSGLPPRPTAEAMRRVMEGSSNSVRSYFSENSRGAFTIENVATLGWYDSDYVPTEYWPSDGSVGRDSGAEAIRKAAREFDFAAFDQDGDGELGVDELFVAFVLPARATAGPWTDRGR